MKHYICTGGCQGESKVPGSCEALACPENGKPLTECDCNDGKHKPESKAPLPPEERETE